MLISSIPLKKDWTLTRVVGSRISTAVLLETVIQILASMSVCVHLLQLARVLETTLLLNTRGASSWCWQAPDPSRLIKIKNFNSLSRSSFWPHQKYCSYPKISQFKDCVFPCGLWLLPATSCVHRCKGAIHNNIDRWRFVSFCSRFFFHNLKERATSDPRSWR
jgi:hypothetical protein